ncbi:SGNH hydrolase-type esterase domain-containing protein [Choanephora cucurbitarum]|nr:SGNH hydrolase-type esterase domain-containing protein [Choanephora cucurbitarum]
MRYEFENISPNQVLQREPDKDHTVFDHFGYDRKYSIGGPHCYSHTNFYVGDVWVMAGQNNMQGLGHKVDPFSMAELHQPVNHDKVFLYDSSEQWRKFNKNPSHELGKSISTINQKLRELNTTHSYELRYRGASLAPAFVNMFKELCPELPIGLIACAQVHSTSADWDPTSKDPDTSLYGAMLNKIEKAGGKIAGVLWYQGESDIKDTSKAENYGAFFQKWISELRRDLDQPKLPIVFVQIGSLDLHIPELKENWKKIQEAQLKFFDQDPYIAGVASVDADLDSSYELSASGLSLVGRRLALAADKAMKGQGKSATPLPESASCQNFSQGHASTSVEIMTVCIAFKHLDSPWKIEPRQRVVGFSFGEAEIPILKAFVINAKTGTVRLYLPTVVKGPLMIHYGMHPGQANLVTQDGRALPAFRNFPT